MDLLVRHGQMNWAGQGVLPFFLHGGARGLSEKVDGEARSGSGSLSVSESKGRGLGLGHEKPGSVTV